MCTTCGCGEGNLYIEGDEHNPHSAFRSAPFAPAARPQMKITGIKAPEFTPARLKKATCITVMAKRALTHRA